MARLFFGESILDAVTDQLETVIYGALKEDYCPATGRKWPVDSKSSSPIHQLNPDKFLLPILAEEGFQIAALNELAHWLLFSESVI